MGTFFKKARNIGRVVDNKANQLSQRKQNKPKPFRSGRIIQQPVKSIGQDMYGDDEFNDEPQDNFQDDPYNDDYGDVNVQTAQKPESFHHFLLDNKFRDLERSIRGYKDVYDKANQKWEVKRKDMHCFTDEESESIIRMVQVHLSADIKLARMSLGAFGGMMNLIYDEINRYFSRISEYRYGRYGASEIQGKMKDENLKIQVEVYNSIWANYSRAIEGRENTSTHDSVRGQESWQGGRDDLTHGNERAFG